MCWDMSDGRSSAESSRRTREVVDAVFYGQRPVQVDQSYIDKLRHAADHNYNKGTEYQNDAVYWKGKAEQFHGEALYWRGRALPAEADAKALRADNERFRPSSPSATPPWLRLRRRLLRSGPPISRRMKKSGASTSSA